MTDKEKVWKSFPKIVIITAMNILDIQNTYLEFLNNFLLSLRPAFP